MSLPLIEKLRPLGVGAGVGAGVGGILGFGLGGPLGMIQGAKTGFMLGAQTGIAIKADKALDATGNKVLQGIDNAGRKVEVIADKTGNAIEKIGNVTADAIVKIADSWSKLFLCGYATQIALNGANLSKLNYNQFCQGAFESLDCASMTLTTISFNACAIACAFALVKDIYKKF